MNTVVVLGANQNVVIKLYEVQHTSDAFTKLIRALKTLDAEVKITQIDYHGRKKSGNKIPSDLVIP